MLKDGLELIFIGMGVVFAFLILLVCCMALMARILARFPDEESGSSSPANPPTSSSRSLAAVAIAVAAARRSRDRSK